MRSDPNNHFTPVNILHFYTESVIRTHTHTTFDTTFYKSKVNTKIGIMLHRAARSEQEQGKAQIGWFSGGLPSKEGVQVDGKRRGAISLCNPLVRPQCSLTIQRYRTVTSSAGAATYTGCLYAHTRFLLEKACWFGFKGLYQTLNT